VEPKKPLIIYHRGRHGKDIRIKENTLKAFARAVKEGAAMIEFDVWGGLCVAHDPNPDSTVPTLEDALECIRGRCAVNIEIKSPRVAHAVAGVIVRELSLGRYREDQIVISSFHHGAAIRLKRLFSRLCVGVVNDGVLEPLYIEWLAKQGINNLHVGWVNIYMDIENGCRMRAAAQANHMQIWAWTVNTQEVFETVVEYGVAAVFTDKPQLFR
jgi:glycerophosphoryl diester phosphodiesterase